MPRVIRSITPEVLVGEKWSLRIEIPKGRSVKKISAIVLKGKIRSINLKSARAELLIRGPNIRLQDQRSCQIVGLEGVHVLKSQGRAAIGTVVFRKGRMIVHGELWGQKRFAFIPPLVVLTIMQLRRVMAPGHIEYGAMERSCAKGRKHPYLVTKEDLLGLEASGLTRRSHGHRLEHSWVSSLILILMKVVIENGGGG
jgi:hypothetical protein